MTHKGNDVSGKWTVVGAVNMGNAKYSWDGKSPAMVPSLGLKAFDLASVAIHRWVPLQNDTEHKWQAASRRALDSSIRSPHDTSFGQGFFECKWLLTTEVTQGDHDYGHDLMSGNC